MKRIHKGLYSEKNNTISYGWKGWELWETKEGITTGEIFYNKLVGIYQSKSKAMNKINNKGNKMNLKEENEILKNKVKHLEQMIEILDTVNKGYYPDFESYNHKTYRNTDGNLITYYTK